MAATEANSSDDGRTAPDRKACPLESIRLVEHRNPHDPVRAQAGRATSLIDQVHHRSARLARTIGPDSPERLGRTHNQPAAVSLLSANHSDHQLTITLSTDREGCEGWKSRLASTTAVACSCLWIPGLHTRPNFRRALLGIMAHIPWIIGMRRTWDRHRLNAVRYVLSAALLKSWKPT
jgi:hypothetical protein